MICESSQLLKSKFFKSFFKNIRETTKDKQSLSDYLIRPVQRITRYELILNQMIHTYQKAGVPCPYIEKAYSVIKEVPTLADNAMKLNSILNYKEKFNGELAQNVYSPIKLYSETSFILNTLWNGIYSRLSLVRTRLIRTLFYSLPKLF